MGVVLLEPPGWACPNCDSTHVKPTGKRGTPYHRCRGLRGLTAPYVPAGTKTKVEAVERGDWVGRETVQTDGDGRPVMAIRTTRDDGIDCAVLAPLATARRSDHL